MMERNLRKIPAALSALVMMGALNGSAQAQSLKLRVADVYPVGHTVSNTTIKVFMDEVKKRVGDQIEFEYYPAEQMGKGKDFLSLTQSGVVDIGLIVPSYISEKLPLSAVSELPGAFSTSCAGTTALHRMLSEGGVLAKYDFAPNGMHVLITHAFAPFQVFSSKPFDSLKSFEGQKLRTLGLVTDLTIKKLGAVPIRLSAPEINESLARGTLDGGLFGVATVISYDLIRYLKTATYGESFGSALVTYAISEASWKKLPPKVQQAMTAAGDVATRNGCEQADKVIDAQYDKIRAGNVAVVKLSDADKNIFEGRTADIGREWAGILNGRGKPGTEVLDAFRSALKAQ